MNQPKHMIQTRSRRAGATQEMIKKMQESKASFWVDGDSWSNLVKRNHVLARDVARYKWLREKLANGEQSYIGEWIMEEEQLDEYIDQQMEES